MGCYNYLGWEEKEADSKEPDKETNITSDSFRLRFIRTHCDESLIKVMRVRNRNAVESFRESTEIKTTSTIF